MKKLSNNSFINILIKLLFLVLLAKFFAVVILWFLPANSQEVTQDDAKSMPYIRVDFHNMLQRESNKHTMNKVETTTDLHTSTIKDMILHGLYGNSSYGYAIVATSHNPQKTEIISIGESYRGYKLSSIALNYVIFTKNNKEYKLELDKSEISTQKTQQSTINTGDEAISVSKKEINYYVKNPAKIWRDISIVEIKKDGKITGFKVTKVRKGSKMAKLGLQRGDIIIKANGIALTSYNAAMKLYKNFNKLKTIALVIKRGNEEKELIYEIH